MENSQYTKLSKVYNALNYGCNYEKLADFCTSLIKEYERVPTSLVLDLACGTGILTLALRSRGYDMTGIDLSKDMLSVAKKHCYDNEINDVLFLCQDMKDFELYGTVDACVCSLDSINYLTKISDVKKCFSLVHNYLIPDGVFIFDINTPYRFESIYAKNDYVIENDGVLCAWQNYYNEKTKICNFYLSIFTENKDGTYDRQDECQKEKCYSKRQIEKALLDSGFEILCVYGSLDKTNANDNDEKWYFVARNIK